MGSSASKQSHVESFQERIKASVNEEVSKRMMIQRELNMALNIAKARDSLQIFGSIYAAGTGGVLLAKVAGKPVPPIAAVPILAEGILLGNMADMAYGNKLARVCKEAEFILDNEKPRFVPFKQAPFAQFYSEEEKAAFFDQSTAVGDLFPSSTFAREFTPPPAKK